MNRAASARIREKKNADTNRRTGNHVRRRVLRRAALDAGVAPLVPHSCFLRYLCLKTPFPQNLFLFIMSFGQEFPARNTAAVAVHRTGIVFQSLKKLALGCILVSILPFHFTFFFFFYRMISFYSSPNKLYNKII